MTIEEKVAKALTRHDGVVNNPEASCASSLPESASCGM